MEASTGAEPAAPESVSEATTYNVFVHRDQLGIEGYTERATEPGDEPGSFPRAPVSEADLLYLGAVEAGSRERAASAIFDNFDPKAVGADGEEEARLDRLRRLVERLLKDETVIVQVGARSRIGPVPVYAEVERRIRVGQR